MVGDERGSLVFKKSRTTCRTNVSACNLKGCAHSSSIHLQAAHKLTGSRLACSDSRDEREFSQLGCLGLKTYVPTAKGHSRSACLGRHLEFLLLV